MAQQYEPIPNEGQGETLATLDYVDASEENHSADSEQQHLLEDRSTSDSEQESESSLEDESSGEDSECGDKDLPQLLEEVALDVAPHNLNKTEGVEKSSDHENECRICHGGPTTAEPDLDTPCNCTGSMAYAHQSCIQRWIQEKGDKTCEICGSSFNEKYAEPTPEARDQVEVAILESDLNRLLNNVRLQDTLDAARQELESQEHYPHGYGYYGYHPQYVWLRTALTLMVALLLLRFLLMLSSEDTVVMHQPHILTSPGNQSDTSWAVDHHAADDDDLNYHGHVPAPAPEAASMPAVILIFLLRLMAPLMPFFLMFQAVQALRIHSANQEESAITGAEMAW
eukprot:CAMPEP_0197859592 /NCGR_PEP_ID=MMETSP1438-20131217/34279_1 /TAXON_ID=1461541 /ORGANISM="Pterosperma sp., Strain CCMP1384" /LENGTH=340 /DNA_ID=CAMNT_0043476135 /DNA_START=195 /DNA_END=1214 /DNA_ORIENTATION=-